MLSTPILLVVHHTALKQYSGIPAGSFQIAFFGSAGLQQRRIKL